MFPVAHCGHAAARPASASHLLAPRMRLQSASAPKKHWNHLPHPRGPQARACRPAVPPAPADAPPGARHDRQAPPHAFLLSTQFPATRADRPHRPPQPAPPVPDRVPTAPIPADKARADARSSRPAPRLPQPEAGLRNSWWIHPRSTHAPKPAGVLVAEIWRETETQPYRVVSCSYFVLVFPVVKSFVPG